MADPLWSRISELVVRALELPVSERAAFIASEAGDDAVRDEVASLVEAAVAGDGFLERLSQRIERPNLTADAPEPPMSGRRIGPWRLLDLLGRGGMGTVYRAERADGAFEQRVALKLLRLPLLGPEGRRRFTAERQILARLEHPAIARLLDGGILEDGVPWFAMEYVEGVPINQACDAARMDFDARLKLFLRACDAVDYAHDKLIVHRDLKPSNVLVTGDGEVKLLDFGVAKLLEADAEESADPHPMTPAYAAPEQLRGDSTSMATDVWALGVLLYELLTGRRPQDAEPLEGAEERTTPGPTTAPSEQVVGVDGAGRSPTQLAARLGLRPRQLQRRLAGDVDAIVLKALEPDAEHRYRNAAELADDLWRHWDGQPVRARPQSLGYRIRCFLGRHRVEAAAATAIAFLLLAVIGVTIHSSLRARADARRLAVERDRAEAISELLLGVFSMADPEEASGAKVTARELLDRGAQRVRDELADQPQVRASMLHSLGRAYRSLGTLDRADVLLSQALALRRGRGRAGNRELADTLQELGQTRLAMGDLKSAEALLREALRRYRQHPHRAPAAQAAALFHLATTLSARSNYAGAEAALREALRLQRDLGDEVAAADTLYALGEVAHLRGRFEEGWQHLQEAVQVYRRVGRTHGPGYARALLSLAAVRHGPQGGAQALAWTEEALALRRQIYDPHHPLVSEAFLAAGDAASEAGRPARAERYFRQALRIEQDRASGSERHVDALSGLGWLRSQQGSVAESIELFERALVISADRPDSTSHIVALNGIGDALRRAGRLAEAERYYRQRLELCRRVFGQDHPMSIRAEVDVARVALARDEFAAAEPTLRRALAQYRKILRPDHPRIAEFELDLGQALAGLGRHAEAEPLLRHAASVLADVYGPDDENARRADRLLASLSVAS